MSRKRRAHNIVLSFFSQTRLPHPLKIRVPNTVQGRFPSNPIAIKNLADKLDVSFTYLMTGEHEKGTAPPTIAEVFESQDFFEGVMRVKLERLVPKKKND